MAHSRSISLLALRNTPLSSGIATKEWTEENFAHLSGQIWYGECSTAAATAAKAVTIPGVTALVPGMNFRIYFTYAQTYNGAPTLNVNGLGAKNIKRVGTTNAARYEWLAGETLDFVYDDNYFRIVDGGVATTTYYGVTKLQGSVSTSNSVAASPGALTSLVHGMIAGTSYWAKDTLYAVGDRVEYTNKIYECVTANTDSTWTASNWIALDPLQVQIDNLSDAVSSINVPTDLSAFTNSPGYLTAHQSLSDLYTLSGEVVEGLSNVVIPTLDTISGLVEDEVEKVDEISAKFDNYSLTGHTHTSSDITNFPLIPTNTNQLVNGAGFITSSQVDTKIAALDGAITGSAGAGKTLTSFSQTDGKVTAGFGNIAITKSQITDFPTIPTVNNGTLTIQKNGNAIASFSANQNTNVSANISVPTKTSELTNDSGFVVSSDLTKVMEYQGSVTNFSDLPNNASKGDVYNVVSANGDYPPGTNYAWSGTSWDPLGGSIDLSKYALTSDLKDLISTITDELSSNINPKLSTIADQVSAEVQKLDELSGSLSEYALTSQIPTVGTLNTTLTASQSTNAAEKLSGTINLHKISKTGSWNDLLNKPSFITSETDPDFHNWLSGNRISVGTGATVSANNGIGLGVGASVGSGIAIGLSSTAVAGTAIGRLAKAQTGIAIGISADSSGSNNNGVAIGYSTKTTCGIIPATGGLRPLGSSIAIGYQSTALCSDSIAIGAPAAVNALSAIQIGLGTNNTQKSLQVWDYQLLDSNGNVPEARVSAIGYVKESNIASKLNNYLPLSGGVISSNFALSVNVGSQTYNVLSGVGPNDNLAFGFNSSATGAGAEAIGIGAVAKGHESYAAGSGAEIRNEYNVDCVAIGYNAVVNAGSSYDDGSKAIQLGYGTNTTPHTMQVFSHTLMDTATGDIPYARLSASLSAQIKNDIRNQIKSKLSAMPPDISTYDNLLSATNVMWNALYKIAYETDRT